jgi:hypothetical protein
MSTRPQAPAFRCRRYLSPLMSRARRTAVAAALLAAAVLPLAACGRQDRAKGGLGGNRSEPALGVKGSEPQAAADLGFPGFATKNTTRVGGADPTANAAAVARAVYPAQTPSTRPPAVILIDGRDWHAGLVASVLAGTPVRGAILLSDGRTLPEASRQALDALRPTGAASAGGAQVIRVGDVARPSGLRTADLAGRDPFALARAVDAFQAAARSRTSDRVLVVSADAPSYAMPAAAWAAKAGDPILFVGRDSLPAETAAALRAHQQPRIYLLGPPTVVSAKVEDSLRRLGTVTRIGTGSAEQSAIDFARFSDGRFGWGVVDPGHGLVFAPTNQPMDAAAAAGLSAHGTYGPLLLLGGANGVDPPLEQFLLDIQPGYTRDPVRGVYNHGWIVGDDHALSIAAQSRIDALLEITHVNQQKQATSP